MKPNTPLFILATLLAMSLGSHAHAQAGGTVKGGDDCERRFKEVRNDLETWLNDPKVPAKGLQPFLPAGVTVDDYIGKMLNFISGKSQAAIRCVGPEDSQRFSKNDPAFNIAVGTTPKTCINYLENSTQTFQIVCNWGKFNKTDGNGQYRLVHHEYAGLADIETGDGEKTDFRVSNEVTEYVGKYVVEKLGIVKRKKNQASQERGTTYDLTTEEVPFLAECYNSAGRAEYACPNRDLLKPGKLGDFAGDWIEIKGDTNQTVVRANKVCLWKAGMSGAGKHAIAYTLGENINERQVVRLIITDDKVREVNTVFLTTVSAMHGGSYGSAGTYAYPRAFTSVTCE